MQRSPVSDATTGRSDIPIDPTTAFAKATAVDQGGASSGLKCKRKLNQDAISIISNAAEIREQTRLSRFYRFHRVYRL